MITYLVEKFPPLVVIGLFHCHTHRRVPNTFTAGQIGIHMFSGARFDDLHPLGRRGSLASTPWGWLWTHCCWFTFGSSNLHFRFFDLGSRQKSLASHVEKGANWQFFTFTGLSAVYIRELLTLGRGGDIFGSAQMAKFLSRDEMELRSKEKIWA